MARGGPRCSTRVSSRPCAAATSAAACVRSASARASPTPPASVRLEAAAESSAAWTLPSPAATICAAVIMPTARSASLVAWPTPRSARTGKGATNAEASEAISVVWASGLCSPAESFASKGLWAMPAATVSPVCSRTAARTSRATALAAHSSLCGYGSAAHWRESYCTPHGALSLARRSITRWRFSAAVPSDARCRKPDSAKRGSSRPSCASAHSAPPPPAPPPPPLTAPSHSLSRSVARLVTSTVTSSRPTLEYVPNPPTAARTRSAASLYGVRSLPSTNASAPPHRRRASSTAMSLPTPSARAS
mmetsp:Transcript_1839/g.7374  ORF Transcript_1839/g.7374 Transcript_1839/m.7374 type:complete len:306 (-) Transcript_1839:324-1241(-)